VYAGEKVADDVIGIRVTRSSPENGEVKSPYKVLKVAAPFPAKPILPAPAGWKFAPSPKGLPAYRVSTKLKDGSPVGLLITPLSSGKSSSPI